jgi:hypothetical protein
VHQGLIANRFGIHLARFKVEPPLKNLEGDDHYKAFLKKVNLPK